MDNGGLSRDMCEHAIDQWIIGRNGERDRFILKMYLFDGITYKQMLIRLEQMADELCDPTYYVGEDHLKKIIRKRKEELFRHV